MRPKNAYWPSKEIEIKGYIDQGLSCAELGLIYGISRKRMYEVLKYFFGIKALTRSNSPRSVKKRYDDRTRLLRRKFTAKKCWAKTKGIEFTLKFEDVDWPVYCPILGLELIYSKTKATCATASFDRLDPRLGYTKENTRIISYRANMLKNNMTLETATRLLAYMKQVY